MDPFSHGLLGALQAVSVARKDALRPAVVAGFVSALLPDLDVLIRSQQDALLQVEFHRQFTHSLLFTPIGALPVAVLLAWWYRGKISFWTLYLFSFLGYLAGGWLDAMTSFGTQLWWPLSTERIAFSVIAVFDPVFTLILIIGVLLAWLVKSRVYAVAALALAVLYLSFGFLQQQRVEQVIQKLAHARNHAISRLEVKPTLGNVLLWRSIYRADDRFYVDAVCVSVTGRSKIYEGDSIAVLDQDAIAARISTESQLYRDIQRFDRLSTGYLVLHPEKEHAIGDVRYSMLPDSVLPLWGIEFDPDNPDVHVRFVDYRDTSKTVRQHFLRMLWGQ